MFEIGLSAFVGALLGFIGTAIIEFQRKPKLEFRIETPPLDMEYENRPARHARFLRLQLWNKSMPRLLKWLGRESAVHCSGDVQFFHFDDLAPVFGSPMRTRWSGADEPLSPQVENGRIVFLFDPGKHSAAFWRNCHPGSKETIDLVARFDDDAECYGWSNDIYIPGIGWRNPEHRLPSGRYFVRVTVYSAGEKTIGYFKLENSAARNNFLIHETNRNEKRRLKALD